MNSFKTIIASAIIVTSTASFASSETSFFDDIQAGNLGAALEKIFDQPAQTAATLAPVPASSASGAMYRNGPLAKPAATSELDIDAIMNMFGSAKSYMENITSK